MVFGLLVFNPTDQTDLEGGFAHHLQQPEALLAHGDDVAAVVVLGLALQDFRTTAHAGHRSFLGVPADHTKAPVAFEDRAQHHPVPRLKDVQRQHFLGEEHHIRQREQRQFSHGRLRHVVAPVPWEGES